MKRFIFLLFVILLTACGTPAVQTPDLFTGVQIAQGTSEALAQQAQFQARFLTATAEAPIIHITETAAAGEFQATGTAQAMAYRMQAWTVTAQSIQATETAAMTATAQSWTPTPNATTTMIAAQSISDTTRIQLETERAQITNKMRAVIGYTFALILLILGVAFAYVLARRLSIMPAKVNEQGRPIPMLDVDEATWSDIERSTNGMISLRQKYLKQLPEITAERQDAVTARSQMVDLATRRARLPKALLNEQSMNGDPQSAGMLEDGAQNTAFGLPAWNLLDAWDGKGIPYYTAHGLDIIDAERFPHLFILGKTRSGKTRGFTRPAVACALASGNRVVMIGESTDYQVFAGHSNAAMVTVNKITEPEQALRYAEILKGIVTEMHRRDDVLTARHQSTWMRMGLPLTYIVLDEFGNALNIMGHVDRKVANQCRAWAEVLTAKGAKYGFSVILVNQRATGMASILANTGAAIFHVEEKEEQVHPFLRGAADLKNGYFMARFGAPKLAGAFEPSDDEISAFLGSRPVQPLDDENGWIDAMIVEPTALPKQETNPALPTTKPTGPNTLADFMAMLGDKELKVVELCQAGNSQRDIERSVFGYVGGAAANKVAEVIRKYRELKYATTTATTGENMPNLGVLAA